MKPSFTSTFIDGYNLHSVTQTHSPDHCHPLLLPLTICCCTIACFFFFVCFYFLLCFVVIMTSRCFNFRFAYPLPLLPPHLHTARMASGHPTDKFSFMYQPDTHKRYGTRMHTQTHKLIPTQVWVQVVQWWKQGRLETVDEQNSMSHWNPG